MPFGALRSSPSFMAAVDQLPVNAPRSNAMARDMPATLADLEFAFLGADSIPLRLL
jgi:hypothetical protein